ncbi:hypothetical protein GA0070616_0088 [Micromonospora nigra]|uniref:Type VII secretion protein EccE n=1 Tax=Micromonospora nigra TaxID=145857 RepID=A0A1C6R7G5_9ACTN|nr:hypothetical protein GA0070616_0088 [Micromonospora nigra]
MSDAPVRTSRLGGEIRARGFLGGARSRTGNIVVSVCLGAGLLIAVSVGGLGGLASGAAIFCGGYVLTRQSHLTGRSPGTEMVLRGWWELRRRRGETELTPVHLAEPIPVPTTKADRRAAGRWARRTRDEAPGLEGLTWLSGPDDAAVLLHRSPGEQSYLSVAIEVDGQPPGLRAQSDYDRAAAAYGHLLARLARDEGLISGIQSVTRIMPTDSAVHERWAADHVDPLAPATLIQSYAELVRMTAGATEMMRHYLVLRLPVTAVFARAAAAHGEGEAGWAQLAVEQAHWVSTLARRADLRNPRLVSTHRLAALLRHLQNPQYPVDQTVDVTSGTWLRSRRTLRHAAVVDEAWWHRVAAIPASAVTPEPVHTRWIAPLLHGITQPVIRTISLLVEVQPAAKARRRAREDVTVDRGIRDAALHRGAVDDGTQAVQLSASAQRLADLQPGSGIHGARWTGYMCVSAASEDEVMRASTALADAAGECGISHLDWLDTRHDTAMPATWPVWRGMEAQP